MIHNFQDLCTTYLVSARRNTLDIDAVGLRLNYCLQRNVSHNFEKPETRDPFCLSRIILAEYINDLNTASVPLISGIVEATNDTFHYTEKPAELKARTINMFHLGSSLRNLQYSLDNMDSLLQVMTATSSRIFELLGAIGPTSPAQAQAAAEDMANPRSAMKTIKEDVFYAEKVKDGIINLVIIAR